MVMNYDLEVKPMRIMHAFWLILSMFYCSTAHKNQAQEDENKKNTVTITIDQKPQALYS